MCVYIYIYIDIDITHTSKRKADTAAEGGAEGEEAL